MVEVCPSGMLEGCGLGSDDGIKLGCLGGSPLKGYEDDNWITKDDLTMWAEHPACLRHSPDKSHCTALLLRAFQEYSPPSFNDTPLQLLLYVRTSRGVR